MIDGLQLISSITPLALHLWMGWSILYDSFLAVTGACWPRIVGASLSGARSGLASFAGFLPQPLQHGICGMPKPLFDSSQHLDAFVLPMMMMMMIIFLIMVFSSFCSHMLDRACDIFLIFLFANLFHFYEMERCYAVREGRFE